jgi:putative aldouronate transport system substrate-binding protein
MACAKCRDGSSSPTSGKHSRRDLMRGAAALGLAAGAAGTLPAGGMTPVAAQDDPTAMSPPPDYIPVHEGDIVAPIAGPLTEEPVSFSVVTMQNAGVSSFEDNRYTDWLEEKTNVHIDWQLVPEEEAEGRLNLMLASGDIPEMIFSIVSPSQQALYGSQGLFLPLNDLIEEHAPNLKNSFEIYPGMREVLTAPDGNIYGMMTLEDCYHCSMSQKLWIYQPWLDTLGLEMPQTTEDFEQVLLAFKERDPNGNGEADEIPLSTTIDLEGWQNSLDLFFMNSFIYNPGEEATGPWLILQDGQVTPIYNTPQWKEGLKYLQRLYAQGLIDPQSFTQDLDGLQRLGNNPDEVILGAAPSGWMGVFIAVDESLQDKRWTEYVPVPPLEGPEGVRYAAWAPATGEPAIVLTNACKDPALAVRWIDAQYDREATLRSERGVLGEDWRWAEEGETDYNGEQAAWKILRLFTDEPTDHAWQGTGPKFISRSLWESQAVDPDTIDLEFLLASLTEEAYEPYKQPAEMVLPPLAFTEEQAVAIADPEATIVQYVKEMFTRFVRGEGDIDVEWEQYLATLDGMGLAAYLRVYKEAFDAKYGG